jgi:hypothetical protein
VTPNAKFAGVWAREFWSGMDAEEVLLSDLIMQTL